MPVNPLLLLGWAVLCGPDSTPGEAVGPDARLRNVAEYLSEQRERQHIPGMSVAIVLDDKLVWSRGFGMADVENDVPARPDTVYRIASISRMITAVAVLQLVQSGKIGLNASVRDYVPELPDKGHRITIEHLLAHLSGLRACKSRDELFNRKHHLRLVDTLDYFKDDPLLAEPGQRFINTPFGYTLLGLVVERVGGLTFGDHIRENIFAPAGMKTAGLENLSAIIPHRARGYVLQKDGSLKNSYFVDLSVRYPGDGMVATAEDLGRFAIGLLTARLLDPPTIELMTTAYRTKSGEQTHYGLGCFVREHNGRRIIGHAGWQPQVATFLLIIPENHASVVVLANLEQADVKTIALSVADMMLGAN
jgi:CubicO group peptidase (beta-lactamase class C family)